MTPSIVTKLNGIVEAPLPWLDGMSIGHLARKIVRKTMSLELMSRAAAIAFYAFSALVPFLIVFLTLTLIVLPTRPAALSGGVGDPGDGPALGIRFTEQIESSLVQILPRTAVHILENQVARIQNRPPYGVLSLGVLISLYLASNVFLAATAALNRIYGVRESRSFWKLSLIAMALTVVEAIILLAALLTITLWPQLAAWLEWSVAVAAIATAIQWAVTVLALLLSFALALYMGPAAPHRFKWITPGSVVATIAVLTISVLFRVYVQNFGSYDTLYGSLAGIIVLLFWIQITSFTLLVGALVNQVICSAASDQPTADGCPPQPVRERGRSRVGAAKARDVQ